MAYEDVVLGLSPSSYWKLDETSGTNAADEMAAFDGTYTSLGTLDQSPLVLNDSGRSVLFDKSMSTRVVFGDNYDFSGSTQFTVMAWINLTAYDSANGHVVWGHTNFSSNGWYLMLLNPAVTITGARLDAGGADNVEYAVAEGAIEGSTHMLAYVFDGTDHHIFWDGAFGASEASSKSLVAPTSNLVLGAGDGGGSGFDGLMDEVAIWSGTALSEADLLSIYEAGTAAETARVQVVTSGARW